MSRFQHLVLTRFNLKYDIWECDREGNPVLTKEWMDHRFMLFDRFCFPSLAGQTSDNFQWIVIFDKDTSAPYRSLIDSYREQFSRFTPVFSDSVQYVDDILLHVDSNTDFLITTRIDNDDALHKNAVEHIQSEFRNQEFEFLNLLRGYVLYDDRIDYLERDCNMFATLVERRKTGQQLKTVMGCGQHSQLRQIGPVRQLTAGSPSWLHVIHERNKSDGEETIGRPNSAIELIRRIRWKATEIRAHLHRKPRSPYEKPVEITLATPLTFERIRDDFSLAAGKRGRNQHKY